MDIKQHIFLLFLFLILILLFLLWSKYYNEIFEKIKVNVPQENQKVNQTNSDLIINSDIKTDSFINSETNSNTVNSEAISDTSKDNSDSDINPQINTNSETNIITTVVSLNYSYANIKSQVGYYFSHDNNIYSSGNKGGFNPGQITEIEIFDVYDDNTIIQRDDSAINRTLINFGDATPKKVYNSRKHNETVTIEDFKYEIPIMYDSNPLINSKGETLKVPVYIGLKGDANLDNKVNQNDALVVLTYINQLSLNGEESIMLLPTNNTLGVSSPTDELDQFAAFLADVSENEYQPLNWKKSKDERTLDSFDSNYILTFLSIKLSDETKSDNDIWSEILPNS